MSTGGAYWLCIINTINSLVPRLSRPMAWQSGDETNPLITAILPRMYALLLDKDCLSSHLAVRSVEQFCMHADEQPLSYEYHTCIS